jgi:hypothetical protein
MATFCLELLLMYASNVALQITRQQESLLTLVACVWFNSGMKQHVAFQHGRRDETSITADTSVLLCIGFVRL